VLQQVLENFSRGPDYPPPWPNNPAWDFSVLFFYIAAIKFIHGVKFVRSYYMIFYPFSVTRVHMLIPMLSLHLSFTGGSSMPKRKCRLILNEDGVLVYEVAIRQHQREAARKAEKEKAAKAQARRRKGKATRPN
jgi:hypothetical protein